MSDDWDFDDFHIGGLPDEGKTGEEHFKEQYMCDFEADDEGNKGSWLEDCKSMVKYNGNTTYVEKGSVQIPFVEVKHMTHEGDKESGAILFTLLDLSTGEVVEKWIPKKLCTNLHPEGYYIYVWNVFAQQHLSKFYEVPDEDT